MALPGRELTNSFVIKLTHATNQWTVFLNRNRKFTNFEQ